MTTKDSILSFLDTAVTEITKHSEVLSDKVFNAPEAEQLVRKATNSDAWGPSGTEMLRISHLSLRHTECRQIMDALWARLTQKNEGKNWRNVYKALLLLEYLLKNGSDRIIGEVRGQIFDLKQLTKFVYVDEGDVDRGLSVRERSKQIIELIHDSERLNAERKTAAKNRAKYSESISSNGFGGGGGGGSSAGHYASQSHFRKNDPTWNAGADDFDKPYGGNQKPAFGGFDSDSDDFTVPKTVPKKENWKPFDEPTKPKSTFKGDGEDSWEDFDVKKGGSVATTKPPAVLARPAAGHVVQAHPQPHYGPSVPSGAPLVQIPSVQAPPPKSSNPLDSIGAPDLIGSGSLLVSTPADKPLPNLFGAPLTPSTPATSTGTLPNLFGAPASSSGFAPTTSSTLTPNSFATPGFGSTPGNAFGSSATPGSSFSSNAFATPSYGNNPPATGSNFAYPPGSFGTQPVTHGYPPNYSYPSSGY